MTKTAARELHALIEKMNLAFKKGSGAKALKEGQLGDDFAQLVAKVSILCRDACDEINRANFPNEDRYSELLERMTGIQRSLLNALCKRGNDGTSGPLVNEVIVEKARGIAEQIENAGILSQTTTTRKEMIAETEALTEEVKEWEIDEYAKKTLIIQLNHISRIIQSADTYSANELRNHVKAIIADFAAEFVKMDKGYQTYLERLVRWGRQGFFAGTVFLGLTADVATVTALLAAPPKMIGKG